MLLRTAGGVDAPHCPSGRRSFIGATEIDLRVKGLVISLDLSGSVSNMRAHIFTPETQSRNHASILGCVAANEADKS